MFVLRRTEYTRNTEVRTAEVDDMLISETVKHLMRIVKDPDQIPLIDSSVLIKAWEGDWDDNTNSYDTCIEWYCSYRHNEEETPRTYNACVYETIKEFLNDWIWECEEDVVDSETDDWEDDIYEM